MWHSTTLLANGTVMVSGGFTDGQQPPTNTVESYDPSTNSWSPLTSLIVERKFHTATLLDNDAVLIVGGGNETPPYIHNSTELYW
jgi:N-acetylneuraminic acid mutarotase